MKMTKKQKKQMVEQMGSTHPLRITYYNKRGHRCEKGIGQPTIPFPRGRWISALSRSPVSHAVNRLLFFYADRLGMSSENRVFWLFAGKNGMTRMWWFKQGRSICDYAPDTM